MNSPCPTCNRFYIERLNAWLTRSKSFHAIVRAEMHHKETCEIVNSSWYKGLWKDAQVGVDVIEVTQ